VTCTESSISIPHLPVMYTAGSMLRHMPASITVWACCTRKRQI
jgi:hypothetical protein